MASNRKKTPDPVPGPRAELRGELCSVEAEIDRLATGPGANRCGIAADVCMLEWRRCHLLSRISDKPAEAARWQALALDARKKQSGFLEKMDTDLNRWLLARKLEDVATAEELAEIRTLAEGTADWPDVTGGATAH